MDGPVVISFLGLGLGNFEFQSTVLLAADCEFSFPLHLFFASKERLHFIFMSIIDGETNDWNKRLVQYLLDLYFEGVCLQRPS